MEGHNLYVYYVWKLGYTGKGIIVSVLDDGLQYNNTDIFLNYEPSVSYDVANLNSQDSDPTPNMTSNDNSHGTYCAAIMAAVANNEFCGVGVAFNAKVGGVRLLEGLVTDLQESLALNFGLEKVDIYSASWGPKDDGIQVDGPGKLAEKALKNGVTKGRKGKGAIYVWAVGNGGLNGDNCNLDGYASSIYTLSVNSLTENGLSCYYDEPCSSTLASVYVGGLHVQDMSFPKKNDLNVVVPSLSGKCLDSFQGTSAAAPMAAGIIALVLEANPHLTWRDVQHLVIRTSVKTNNDTGWLKNAVGFNYHLIYGFGALNSYQLVKAAIRWVNVPPQKYITISSNKVPWVLNPFEKMSIPIEVASNTFVSSVEHVNIHVILEHEKRGQLEIFLISPAGTVSQILTIRKKDNHKNGFKWNFMSVHFWGESPVGIWHFQIINYTHLQGILNSLHLVFYGFNDKFDSV